MTGSACAWDVDGVEVPPIQQRAVLRDLRRALVDPQLDGVVLARALYSSDWKKGFDSAVECVDARVEHLTGHIEGLAEAVPPVQAAPASGDLAEAVARLREQIDVCEAEGTGGCVMETPRDGARQMAVDLRLVLAAVPAITPGDDRGRDLATEAEKPLLLAAVHRLGGRSRIRAFERSEDGRWFPACLHHWGDPFSDDLGTFEDGDAALLSLLPHVVRRHPEWLTEAERLAATPGEGRGGERS